MKITGLITEYNPFHSGHLYHIKKAKEITGADYCAVLMSGSFVQRGEPAVFDKYTRTRMALLSGADLVFEMPAAFSTASAMEFAAFGVSLFSALGAVDCLVFGSESGNLEALKTAARLLTEEPPEFKNNLRLGLRSGLTYPLAREKALAAALSRSSVLSGKENLSDILSAPNNILGIEYLRAGLAQKSHLKFYTVRRSGSDYHEGSLPADRAVYPSASALRREIYRIFCLETGLSPEEKQNLLIERCHKHIPKDALPALIRAVPVFADDFSELLSYRILCGVPDDIAELSPELAARIKKSVFSPLSFSGRAAALKTKDITYTRISRALLHLILNIRSSDTAAWKAAGYAPYARILGFRRESRPLLTQLAAETSIPIITKTADAAKKLSEPALSMLEQEIFASHLYQTMKCRRGGSFQNEYTEGLIII